MRPETNVKVIALRGIQNNERRSEREMREGGGGEGEKKKRVWG